MNYINLHLKEFKYSLFYCFISILSLIIVIFEYIETFISYYISLTETNIHFIFTDIMEVFYINIKLSILFSFIFSLPFILLILFLFIKPALYSYENNLINKFYFSFNFLMLPCIIYSIPNITIILINYFNQQSYNQFIYYDVELLQRFSNFYDWLFYLNLVFIFSTMVSLIIIIIILPKLYLYNNLRPDFISPIPTLNTKESVVENKSGYRAIEWEAEGGKKQKKNSNYIKNRKYLYFLVLFFIALITPPDVLSLIILFIPFFFIYELVIYIICIFKILNAQ